MISDFLNYSLKNGCKIAVLFMRNGKMERKNLTVVSVDPEAGTFSAVPAGRKKEAEYALRSMSDCPLQ